MVIKFENASVNGSNGSNNVYKFGDGTLVVAKGTYRDEPAVFVAPAKLGGKVGDVVQEVDRLPTDKLIADEIILVFPTVKKVDDFLGLVFESDNSFTKVKRGPKPVKISALAKQARALNDRFLSEKKKITTEHKKRVSYLEREREELLDQLDYTKSKLREASRELDVDFREVEPYRRYLQYHLEKNTFDDYYATLLDKNVWAFFILMGGRNYYTPVMVDTQDKNYSVETFARDVKRLTFELGGTSSHDANYNFKPKVGLKERFWTWYVNKMSG